MVRVYSSPNISMVHLVKHALENDGIACEVRGEHLAGAAGGVAPIDAWGELWIKLPEQAEVALELIDEILAESDEVDDPWICPDCIEWREGPFARCWKCGAERLD